MVQAGLEHSIFTGESSASVRSGLVHWTMPRTEGKQDRELMKSFEPLGTEHDAREESILQPRVLVATSAREV